MSKKNQGSRALNALMVAAKHNGSAWAPNLRAVGNTTRAARGEEALWTSLAPIERGPDGRTAFMYSAMKGDLPRVKWLLEKTPEVLNQEDSEGHTALTFAALYSRTAVIEALLDAGADIDHRDVYGDTLLHFASVGELKLDDVSVVDLLLARGLNVNTPNDNGTTSLMMACISGSLPRVKRLLDAGADVNLRQTDDLYTALHFACEIHTPGLIDVLVGAGANKTAQINSGETPLQVACSLGIVENVKDLLRNRVNLNTRTLEGNTALHILANNPRKENDVEIARLLLSAGCAVDAVNNDEETPLHLSSKNGNTDLVNVLLDYGADADLIDDRGSTALHLAVQGAHIDIIRDLARVTNTQIHNRDGLTPKALFTRRVAFLRGSPQAFSDEVIGELDVLLEPLHYRGHIMGRANNINTANFHSNAEGGRRYRKNTRKRLSKKRKTRRH